MGTALDALASQPLVNRRPAAPTLPSFELPPPQFGLPGGVANKFSTLPNHPPVSHPPANVSVGNLLTPPATNQSGETIHPQHHLASAGASELPPTYWPGNSPYGAQGSGSATQAWASGVHAAYQGRPTYSPGIVGRHNVTSPPATDGLSQPFEAPSLASFQQGLPAPPSSVPPHVSHPATMALYSSAHATSPAPLPSNDPYAPKHPSLYGAPPHLSPHQTGFSPIYAAPSLGGAGLGMNHPGRMPAQSPTGQSHLGYPPRQPWPSYSLPAMNGPVMTNVHSPNSPMAMMGGCNRDSYLDLIAVMWQIPSTSMEATRHPMVFSRQPQIVRSNVINVPRASTATMISSVTSEFIWRLSHSLVPIVTRAFRVKTRSRYVNQRHILSRASTDYSQRHILVKGCGKDGDSDGNNNQMGDTIKGERSEDGSPTLNGRV
ncbi:hypothetical protein N7486_005962 [Penicillium sp. IBT 16267x]|nr:hypothetical protein N7486_005962 [Penicillium sp. IBT 16267x]